MRMTGTIGWGLIGSATTMLVRRATRRAMYTEEGTTRLPLAARRQSGVGFLLFAALTGATLAIADVLQEHHRRRNAETRDQLGLA